MVDSPFAGIEHATMAPERIYFPPGFVGDVRIETLEKFLSRKKELFFVATFTILRSNLASHPEGSRATWMPNFKHEATLGHVKRFLAAVAGIPLKGPDGRYNPRLSEITTEACELSVDTSQPCAGKVVHLTTSATTTQGGNPFTVHNWEPAR